MPKRQNRSAVFPFSLYVVSPASHLTLSEIHEYTSSPITQSANRETPSEIHMATHTTLYKMHSANHVNISQVHPAKHVIQSEIHSAEHVTQFSTIPAIVTVMSQHVSHTRVVVVTVTFHTRVINPGSLCSNASLAGHVSFRKYSGSSVLWI